mmetsp:Transcript_72949/g.145037  ORF Transcript_72949/g.145037 Transcript_72949/m.145037 type:complete len:86 (+) Transcript_72949:883-1140(+)
MNLSQFVRLIHSSGIFELTGLSKTDLELLFLRITNEQYNHRSIGLHSFARALAEIADLAFPAEAERADRFECLLQHVAQQQGACG